VRGGREGLFLPEGEPAECLFLPEGPTDTAALLSLGFFAVGRPSCQGGVSHAVGYVRRHRPRQVVVVADADTPGQDGARRLAAVLRALARDVRLLMPPPPHKDVRDWVRDGATKQDIEAAVATTTQMKGFTNACK